MAVEFPHFTLPFAWSPSDAGGLGAAVAEQESIAEIAGCVEAIVRTVQGERTTLPEFGIPELEFNADAQLAAAALASAVLTFEPRADALVTGEPDPTDVAVQVIRALIAPADNEEGEQQ